MTLSAKTPLALYKANLELVLRLGTLLQENRKRWSQAGAGQANDAIQRTLAQTERLLTANDFSALSTVPGEDFWKSLRDLQAPVQASVESALGHQAAFAQGLQEAFEAWRQQSADALGTGDASLPAVFADFMKPSKPTEPAPAAPRKSGAKTKTKAKAKTKAKRKPA